MNGPGVLGGVRRRSCSPCPGSCRAAMPSPGSRRGGSPPSWRTPGPGRAGSAVRTRPRRPRSVGWPAAPGRAVTGAHAHRGADEQAEGRFRDMAHRTVTSSLTAGSTSGWLRHGRSTDGPGCRRSRCRPTRPGTCPDCGLRTVPSACGRPLLRTRRRCTSTAAPRTVRAATAGRRPDTCPAPAANRRPGPPTSGHRSRCTSRSGPRCRRPCSRRRRPGTCR